MQTNQCSKGCVSVVEGATKICRGGQQCFDMRVRRKCLSRALANEEEIRVVVNKISFQHAIFGPSSDWSFIANIYLGLEVEKTRHEYVVTVQFL